MKRIAITLLLAACSAHELHQADAGTDAGHELGWLCYCNGVARTCTDAGPICSESDPSKSLGCACRAAGECNPEADCIEVHAPKEK